MILRKANSNLHVKLQEFGGPARGLNMCCDFSRVPYFSRCQDILDQGYLDKPDSSILTFMSLREGFNQCQWQFMPSLFRSTLEARRSFLLRARTSGKSNYFHVMLRCSRIGKSQGFIFSRDARILRILCALCPLTMISPPHAFLVCMSTREAHVPQCCGLARS